MAGPAALRPFVLGARMGPPIARQDYVFIQLYKPYTRWATRNPKRRACHPMLRLISKRPQSVTRIWYLNEQKSFIRHVSQ